MLLRYDVIEFLQIDGNKLTLRVKDTGFVFKWDCWNPFTESKNPPPKELYGHWITDKGYRSKAVRLQNKIMTFNTFAQRIYNEQKEKKQQSLASSKTKGIIATAAAVRVRKASMVSGIIDRSAENKKKQRGELQAALSEKMGKMGNANSNNDDDTDADHPYGSLLIMATTTTTGKMHGSSVRAATHTTSNTAKNPAPTPEKVGSGMSTPPLDIEEEILAAFLSKINGVNEKEKSNSSAAAVQNNTNRKRSSSPRPDHHVSQTQTQPNTTGSASSRSSSFDSESPGNRPKRLRNGHRQRKMTMETSMETAMALERQRNEPTTQQRSSPTLRSESPTTAKAAAAAASLPVPTSPTAAPPAESPIRFRDSLPDELEPTHFEELTTQRRLKIANAIAKGQPRHEKHLLKRLENELRTIKQQQKMVGGEYQDRITGLRNEVEHFRNLCQEQVELLLNEKSRLEDRLRALMANQNCFQF
jgi:hypothetical protein